MLNKKIFLLLAFSTVLLAEEPKLFYEEDPTSLVSTIQVAVQTGFADDPINKVGLANLYAELMLRGTKKHSREAFQSAMERMGATLAVGVSHDRITFVGKVIQENSMAFLKLIEECLLHPTFNAKGFDSLKTELLNGTAFLKNSNNRLGGLAIRKEMFQGTPLERPGTGSVATLKAIKLADAVRAYNDAFHRANFVWAVASPLPEVQWKKAIKEIWLQFPDGAQRAKRVFPPKLPQKPTLIVIHKPKTSTGVLSFAQGGLTAQDATRYTLATGNFSFGGEPLVSRLFRTIRGQLGWTYAINSGYSAMGPLSFQQGIYTIASTPSVEYTAKTLLKTISSWQEYLDKGLSSDEMDLARDSMINSYPFEFESAEKRLGQKLYSYFYGVPLLSPEEYAKTIGGIDNSALKKALKEKHTAQGWWVALVADKEIVAKQLAAEQKAIPKDEQIVISNVLTPDQVIE